MLCYVTEALAACGCVALREPAVMAAAADAIGFSAGARALPAVADGDGAAPPVAHAFLAAAVALCDAPGARVRRPAEAS